MNVYIVTGVKRRPSAVFADMDAAIDYANQAEALHGINSGVLETELLYGQGSFPSSSKAVWVKTPK